MNGSFLVLWKQLKSRLYSRGYFHFKNSYEHKWEFIYKQFPLLTWKNMTLTVTVCHKPINQLYNYGPSLNKQGKSPWMKWFFYFPSSPTPWWFPSHTANMEILWIFTLLPDLCYHSLSNELLLYLFCLNIYFIQLLKNA